MYPDHKDSFDWIQAAIVLAMAMVIGIALGSAIVEDMKVRKIQPQPVPCEHAPYRP